MILLFIFIVINNTFISCADPCFSSLHCFHSSNFVQNKIETNSMEEKSKKINVDTKYVNIDAFCLRQFKPAFKGAYISSLTPEQLEDLINDKIEVLLDASSSLNAPFESLLVDGYAPFCKHLFIQNPIEELFSPIIEITSKNENLLKSGYETRSDKELPVLERWFNKKDLVNHGIVFGKAKYLDIILYSREQIIEEDIVDDAKEKKIELTKDEMDERKMNKLKENKLPSWAVISIRAQDVDYEIPMSVSYQLG